MAKENAESIIKNAVVHRKPDAIQGIPREVSVTWIQMAQCKD